MAPTRRRGTETDAEALLRRVAADNADVGHELADAILDRLRGTVPEFFGDDDVAYDMAAAVAANVRRVQQLLAHTPETAMTDAIPLEASDLLQSTIQHGIPLISLLEAYRSAQGLAGEWWQDRLERAEAPAAVVSRATRMLNQLVLAYIDHAAARVRESYEIERRAAESSSDGRRAHLIRRLLSGEALDTDAAARTLNHPLHGRHVALVLWRTDDRPDDALDETLAAITAAVGPVRSLTTSARHRVYAWLSTSGPLAVEAARGLVLPADVHVAMSGVHTGVAGFVRAHEDAVSVANVVRGRGAGGGGRVAVYEEVELLTLLARDGAACDRFVHRVLGRLADDTPGAARDRATLAAYLASGSSPSRAARRLGVHRNTVLNRLATLRDVLPPQGEGEWSAHAARRLEVEVALRLVGRPPG